MNTAKKKSAKVKTLFSPTAITQHIADRLNQQRRRRVDEIFKRTVAELRAIKARSKRANRIEALAEKTIDKIFLGQIPANLEVVKDFKRQAAAL